MTSVHIVTDGVPLMAVAYVLIESAMGTAARLMMSETADRFFLTGVTMFNALLHAGRDQHYKAYEYSANKNGA